MLEQQLLTELAVAERNTSYELRYNRLRFTNEVMKVFSLEKVSSYFDLIRTDVKKALELRDIAKKEKLI